ncbi:MAG: NAD-binding protein, partial [Conexivisphaera sp.]
AYQELLEVLKSFSSRVYYMGEGFSAMAAKLAVSIIAASYVEALGEAAALATSAGVDMKAFAQVISSVYGDRIPFGTSVGEALDGSPKPSINLTSLITELRLAIATADERNVAIPTAGLLDSLYTAALSRGGDGDYTAIVGFVKGLSARPE